MKYNLASIDTVHKTTSENGQTHDGSLIYTHDRHCHAVLPVPAERATLAMREDGNSVVWAARNGLIIMHEATHARR